MYWDFENLHASLCESAQENSYSRPDGRFKVQDPLIDVQAVVEVAASFGPLAINRAYCNWQYFGRYRDALLQNSVELVQLFPPGSTAKNGADIKLCLDATEDTSRQGHIGTVVVVSGDSDFMPLSQKLKAAGRRLVGIGTQKATNRHWAKSCHEFRYYERLLEMAATSASATGQLATPAAAVVVRALQLLVETTGETWITKNAFWAMVKRLDSTFDLAHHGFANLDAMLAALDRVVEVKTSDADLLLRLR